MQTGRESDVEAVEDEDGHEDFLEEDVPDFGEFENFAREKDHEKRQKVLREHHQQHHVHVLQERVRVADGADLFGHHVGTARRHYFGSTNRRRAEFRRLGIRCPLRFGEHLGSEIEAVHEPPVEEGTEIEIDELVAGQAEVCQLEHSEEFQADDFATEQGQEQKSVTRIADCIRDFLVLLRVLAFLQSVLDGRHGRVGGAWRSAVQQVRASEYTIAEEVLVRL